MNISGVYIRLDLISDHFNMDIKEVLLIIKSNKTINFKYNRFLYRTNYYITIEYIFYVIYKHYYTFIDKNIFDNMSSYYNTPELLLKDIVIRSKSYNKDKYKNSILLFNDKKKAGYVYLAVIGDLVKIGATTNPAHRCYTIKRDSAKVYVDDFIEMNTLIYKPTFHEAMRLETKLHKEFKDHNYTGEWFNDAKYIIDTINKEYAEFILI